MYVLSYTITFVKWVSLFFNYLSYANFLLTNLKMVLAENGICSVHVKALNDYVEFKFS
jgi:hypothetical protein